MKYFIRRLIPPSIRPAFVNALYQIRAPFFRGHAVHCPCCEGDFKMFASFNSYGTIRKNVQCPKCGSLERHRLLWLYLLERTSVLKKRARMLHIAPEPILQTQFKKTSGLEYISVDIASPLAMVKMNIEHIPYEDNFIDAILCFHVLDHVDDDQAAMREMLRVLKQGGWAIIQSAVDPDKEHTFEDSDAKSPEERLKVFGQVDLARKYGMDFTLRLKNAGFDIEKVQYGKELNAEAIVRYGLHKEDTFYLCTKPEINEVA